MASNQTANFGLNQWGATNKVLREEFNADNAKIDAALSAINSALPKIVADSYTGNGAATRTISLGFTPKAVLLTNQAGQQTAIGEAYHFQGGLALQHSPCVYSNVTYLSIVEGGFQVVVAPNNGPTYRTNENGTVYHYIAIG